jgi:hypothetical protein
MVAQFEHPVLVEGTVVPKVLQAAGRDPPCQTGSKWVCTIDMSPANGRHIREAVA